MKILRHLALMVTLSVTALANPNIAFEPTDTIASVLKRQIGERVELRLKSGEKLDGKVTAVGEKAAQISALTGQEFFDAVVVLDDISAVVIRRGEK